MNPGQLMDHLVSAGIFTRYMAEECASKVTTLDKNRYIVNLLPRRGPTAGPIFVEALRNTHQNDLAYIFDPLNRVAPIVAKRVFRELAECVLSLQPTEILPESSGTSVSIYSKHDPNSSLEIGEIPFVFAEKSGLYDKDDILSWPNAPSKNDFERALSVYDLEVAELTALIKLLDGGGFEFLMHPKDDRIYRLVMSLNKPYLTVTGETIRLVQQQVECDQIAINDINIMAAALHLICFGDHKFVIRKTWPWRPSSYLVRNARALTFSPVIIGRLTKLVQYEVVTDAFSACPL